MLGRRTFLANAFLRAGLAGDTARNEVFSAANGSGTSDSPMVARFMALSEALERWAHWQLCTRADGGIPYGFDVDPSTNGMAAYPGLWGRQARPGALMEASERFNLLNWWEGHLPAAETATQWPGVRAAVMCSGGAGHHGDSLPADRRRICRLRAWRGDGLSGGLPEGSRRNGAARHGNFPLRHDPRGAD